VSSYQRALELAGKLNAAGITATVDPRAATPPCVLIPPPDRTLDITCGYTARWALVAMVPGNANADAHKALDALVDQVCAELPIERASVIGYSISADQQPVPAYRLEFTEGVSNGN
jgi:hypothetical protein